MTEDKTRKLRWQAEEVEDRVRDLKKKETETTHLVQDIARLHQRQREVLNEILYYSKGTHAERSATIDLEDLEQEQHSVMHHFEEGQEALHILRKSEQTKQDQLEDDLLMLQRKEEEEKDAEN
ncbi:hypothetical protein A5821_001332 [Enterococcus sp. 7F3_DIV0205]|uniref:Uncharacterized protein n=1 Tax=Candidatus Enterococcus palustris TaxID=1834189 RepID=A0AAQ3W7P2_9ENTE|nr:hypothetical protein [Enterococcus sp. 7F3_DIV0205]OTN85730.1 hypothetical protein A5821_001676 [Enterococcus sp. 7F3_DIV0205]